MSPATALLPFLLTVALCIATLTFAYLMLTPTPAGAGWVHKAIALTFVAALGAVPAAILLGYLW